MNINKQIEKMAATLPEGWRVCLEVEKNSGQVCVYAPNGESTSMSDGDSSIEQQFYDAVDFINKASQEIRIVSEKNMTLRYKGDVYHSDNDLPAVTVNGIREEWYQDGLRHRGDDKPAVVFASGDKYWYQNNQLHRDGDKPAIECANGDRIWLKKGLYHRDGDKPAVEHANGTKYWYQNGLLHRDGDKPAVEYTNGYAEWYKNGVKYHPYPGNIF